MTKPVTGIQTFAGVSPPWNLSLLDANFAAFLAAINDVGTYSNYLVDGSGAANQITVTTAGSVTFALVAGALLQVKVANTTTSGTVAMTVNGGPSTPLVGFGGIALIPGQLVAGGVYLLLYDGTNWQTINALSFGRTAAEISSGITPVNYVYLPGNVLRYGTNTTPGTTDMTNAIQNCITVCGVSGDRCVIPASTYKITADITVPVGVPFLNTTPFAVDIQGSGREQTILQFSGGAIVNGIYFNGVSGFKLCGKISDLTIDGNTVAPTGLTFANCDMPRAERLIVRRFTGRGVLFNTTIMGRFDNCYVVACGSAGQAQVEILSSTTFEWHQSYCSSGNAAAVAAVRVDKSANTNFFGGAVETPGTIQIGALADTTVGCVGGVIFGMDFEKPTDHFLEFGYGMSGSAFVQGWQVRGNTGFPSGAASVPYAVKLNACTSIRFGDNNWSQNGSPTATYWLEGVTNNGVVIEAHPELYGFAWPWVMQNGAQIASATPLIDFTQKDVVGDGTVPNQGTISGTTASNAVHATQGGIYERLLCGNGGPTTMTALTGGKRGMRLYMMDPNGNTTLTHSTVTADRWNIKAGANLAMVANVWYAFMHSGTLWVQL